MADKHDDPTPKSAPAKPAAPPPAPPSGSDLKTEQEKAEKLDPVDPPVDPGPRPETIEEQGIGARQPYPTKET